MNHKQRGLRKAFRVRNFHLIIFSLKMLLKILFPNYLGVAVSMFGLTQRRNASVFQGVMELCLRRDPEDIARLKHCLQS